MSAVIPQRASHKKHRTGCITCKNRHVKCDETKPVCLQCQKVKRKCEGYAAPEPITRKRKPLTFRRFVNVSPLELMQPSKARTGTPGEAVALDHFMSRTSAMLLQQFSSQPWISTLLYLQQYHPAIRHSCLAVGSLHTALSQYEASQAAPDALYVMESAQSMALSQYTTALRLLRAYTTEKDFHRPVLWLACIMFTIFESLRGNRDEMLVHLRNGISMTHSTDLGSHESSEFEIKIVLERLGYLHAMYGRPRMLSSPEVKHLSADHFEDSFEIPELGSIHVARTVLHWVSKGVMSFLHTLEKGIITDLPTIKNIQLRLRDSLLRWSAALDEQRAKPGSWVDKERAALGILYAQYETATIFLFVYPTGSHCEFDSYTERFEHIINEMDKALPSHSPAGSDAFSIDLGIIPMLFFLATTCRHPLLRRKALMLLHRAPRREVVWDAELMAKTVQLVIDFEEKGLDVVVEDGAVNIPEERRVRNIDIEDEDEDNPAVKVVTLWWRPDASWAAMEQKTFTISCQFMAAVKLTPYGEKASQGTVKG